MEMAMMEIDNGIEDIPLSAVMEPSDEDPFEVIPSHPNASRKTLDIKPNLIQGEPSMVAKTEGKGLNPELVAQLTAPFDPSELEFRPITFNKDNTAAIAFAYINPRAVQDRLDLVLPGRWSFSVEVVNVPQHINRAVVVGSLTVIADDGSLITRQDIGEADINLAVNQDINGFRTVTDAYKSATSDALKRAAVNFGIGRYLYSLPSVWIEWEGTRYNGSFKVSPAEVLFDGNGQVTESAQAKDTKSKGKGKGKGKSAPAVPSVPAPSTVGAVTEQTPPTTVPTAGMPMVPGGAPTAQIPVAPSPAPAPVAPAPQVTPPAPAAPAPQAQAQAPNAQPILQNQLAFIASVYASANMGCPDEVASMTVEQASEWIRTAMKNGGNQNPPTTPQLNYIAGLCSQLGVDLPTNLATMQYSDASPMIQQLMQQVNASKGK